MILIFGGTTEGRLAVETLDEAGAPFVVCGGPCAFNPEPLAPFVDIVSLGEGEDVTVEMIQLYRRARESVACNEVILDTTQRIGEFFVEQFVAQPTEVMYQLCLDAKGRLLSCRKVCEGDAAALGVNLRKIVENAILSNAVLVALAHNHPSGVALPSHEDKIATLQIRDALEAVNVTLADHIIVADDDYVSLRQEGLL